MENSQDLCKKSSAPDPNLQIIQNRRKSKIQRTKKHVHVCIPNRSAKPQDVALSMKGRISWPAETPLVAESTGVNLIGHASRGPKRDSREISQIKTAVSIHLPDSIREYSNMQSQNTTASNTDTGFCEQHYSSQGKRQKKESIDTVSPTLDESKLGQVTEQVLDVDEVDSYTVPMHGRVQNYDTNISVSVNCMSFLNSPSSAEVEEFLSQAEQRELKLLSARYNFDFQNEVPMPGRHEWIKVTGSCPEI